MKHMQELEVAVEALTAVSGGATPIRQWAYHTVQEGDSLYELAERFHTTVNWIVYYNNYINDRNHPVPGWQLRIPVGRTGYLTEKDTHVALNPEPLID